MRLGRITISKELIRRRLDNTVILNMFRKLEMIPIKMRCVPKDIEALLEYVCISVNFPENDQFNFETDFDKVPEFIIICNKHDKFFKHRIVFELIPRKREDNAKN